MPTFKCSVCGGTFVDPQPDQTQYFHACPPLSRNDLLAMPPATVVALIPSLPAIFTPAQLDAALTTITVERPGKRNENIQPGYKNPPLAAGNGGPQTAAPMIAPNGARQ